MLTYRSFLRHRSALRYALAVDLLISRGRPAPRSETLSGWQAAASFRRSRNHRYSSLFLHRRRPSSLQRDLVFHEKTVAFAQSGRVLCLRTHIDLSVNHNSTRHRSPGLETRTFSEASVLCGDPLTIYVDCGMPAVLALHRRPRGATLTIAS